MNISGKALLVIEREHNNRPSWDVHSIIETCNGGKDRDIAADCARENFSCLAYDVLPLPDSAYKLSPGDRIWVKVVYEMQYHTDYYGEVDVDLSYRKQRVIRRKRYL